MVLVVAFTIARLSPTDPLLAEPTEEALVAAEMNDELVRLSLRKEGLDLPSFYFYFDNSKGLVLTTHNQFHRWLLGTDGSTGILQGNLGTSLRTHRPVGDMIREDFAWSLGLTVGSLVVAFLICIPIGLYAASHSGGGVDRFLDAWTLVLFSLPAYLLATLLQLVFANPDFLGWLPATGAGPSRTDHPMFIQRIPYLVLPVVCYLLAASGYLFRSIRDAGLRELATDHVRTARAKGQTPARIRLLHVLRPMLPSLITVFAQAFPIALSGSVLLETVFGLPGTGRLIEISIRSGDYPVLSGIFLLLSLVTLVMQWLADLIIMRTDPRTADQLTKA
jgi:peptide/nickel transport system permease protein